jgi:hypothetical protein
MARKTSKRVGWDVWVYNEATGFIVTSRAMSKRGFDVSNQKKWARAVAAREILPLELAQDDPFIIRVVLGGALSEAEIGECVGRFESSLELGDELVVSGGVEYISEGEEWHKDYSRVVPVPKGSYRVELFTYLPGMNGEFCLREAGGDPDDLAAWWKKSHGRKRPPAWIEGEADEDMEYAQFLLHLTPLEGKAPPVPKLSEGFVPCSTGARKPEKCPLGLAASDVQGKPAAPPPKVVTPVDIEPLVRDCALAPLARPVELPLEKLERLYMLAMLASSDVHPELSITLPPGATFAPTWPKLEGSAVTTDGQSLRIGMEETGARWGGAIFTRTYGPALAALPDGSVFELRTARMGSDDARAGRQRYRGTVKNGVLSIAETHPAVEPAILSQALALSQALESGNQLPIDSEQQGLAVLELIRLNEGLMFRKSIVEVRGSQLVFTCDQEGLLAFAAVFVFRLRFGATWPVKVWDQAQPNPRGSVDRDRKRFVGDRVPPEAGEPIHNGRSASFSRGAITNFPAAFDAELTASGFVLLGDVICSKLASRVLRGYGHQSETAYGSFSSSAGDLGAFEIFSVFEDGARLTTTTNVRATTDAKRKLFGFAHPELALGQRGNAVRELLKLHTEEAKKLAQQHGPLRAAPSQLAAYASSIDDALVLWGM